MRKEKILIGIMAAGVGMMLYGAYKMIRGSRKPKVKMVREDRSPYSQPLFSTKHMLDSDMGTDNKFKHIDSMEEFYKVFGYPIISNIVSDHTASKEFIKTFLTEAGYRQGIHKSANHLWFLDNMYRGIILQDATEHRQLDGVVYINSTWPIKQIVQAVLSNKSLLATEEPDPLKPFREAFLKSAGYFQGKHLPDLWFMFRTEADSVSNIEFIQNSIKPVKCFSSNKKLVHTIEQMKVMHPDNPVLKELM